MAKRKLSAEEKREKLLELLHETCDIFSLKDLERLAPKRKGIVQQAVKITLQELVDNGQVSSDKIANGIYYWAFPSEAINGINRRLKNIKAETATCEERINQAQAQLNVASQEAKNTVDTKLIVEEIEVLKKEKLELQQRVKAAAGDIDFVAVAAKSKDTKKIVEAANRWTDNVFLIKSWAKRKFDKQDGELNKSFGIPEDLNYLDD